MRGTPNEFFSFLPDHERNAAIQAFAIIRRCDETLRFEALVGSWLVSRLISILRIDGTALQTIDSSTNDSTTDPSSRTMVGNFDASSDPRAVSSSASINDASRNVNVNSGGQGVAGMHGLMTHPPPAYNKKEAAGFTPGVSAAQVAPGYEHFSQDPSPPVAPTSEYNGSKSPPLPPTSDEPKDPEEFPEEFDPDNPIPESYMVKHKIKKLRKTQKKRIIISSDKPLFMYVGHLQSSGAAMNGFATHLAGIISSFSTTRGTSTTVASTISYCLNLLEHSEHRSKLLNGLCSIIIHCHPSMKKEYDDDERALDDDSDGIIIPEKARMDLKRIMTTALCCILLQVKTSCEAVQDFDYIWEACCDKAGEISSVFQDNDLTSKECAWLLSIGSYLSEDLSSQSLTHADRRRIRLLLSGASVLMIAQSTLLLRQKASESSFLNEDGPRVKRQRFDNVQSKAYDRFRAAQLRQEEQSIAQICNIGKENVQEETTTKKYVQEQQQQILLDIVLSAVNDLSLYGHKVTLSTICIEFNKVSQIAAKLNLFHNIDANIEKIVSSCSPIQTEFSTHHDRISSVPILEEFCKVLLSSSQNSYSPNGPSIFTGFSFVDETLLVCESTTYVRLYLIDYDEREDAMSVEHVSANVRFYKSSIEPGIESETEDTEPIERLQVEPFIKKGDMIDTLDFNTWTEMLLESSSKRIKPSTKLLFYIGSCNNKNVFSSNQNTVGKVMIPVLNRALERLSQTDTTNPEEYLNVDATGKMKANYKRDSKRISLQAKIIGRAMVSLFYDALESILDYETGRLKTTSHTDLLTNPSFHKALLSICLICVVHATSGNSTNFQQEKNGHGSQLFVHSILKLMDCTSYEYMKVSESFTRSMEHSSRSLNKTIHKLPKLLLKKLQDAEIQILESLLWSRCPNTNPMRTTIGVLDSLISRSSKSSMMWPPKILRPIQDEDVFNELGDSITYNICAEKSSSKDSEISYVDYLMTKLLSLVSQRVALLAVHLEIPPHFQVIRVVWYTFRQLLRKNLNLLYDRNVDQLILCTIYGTCKVMRYKPELTFTKIINVYNNCFDERLDKADAQKNIRNVKMKSVEEKGTVIEFYNQIYLPTMKKYLLKSKGMVSNTQETSEVESHTGRIKFQGSNIHLNISSDTTPLVRKEHPRTRALYSFGDASSIKNIKLINQTLNS